MQDYKDHIKRQLFNRLIDPMSKVAMPANGLISGEVRLVVHRIVYNSMLKADTVKEALQRGLRSHFKLSNR